MRYLITLVTLVIIVLIVEFIIFYNKYKTSQERNDNQYQLWVAIVITFVVAFILYFIIRACDKKNNDEEYGFFSKKEKKTVPPVVTPQARSYGGNPMKSQKYNLSKVDDVEYDASKYLGGASAASDINRRPLYKKK